MELNYFNMPFAKKLFKNKKIKQKVNNCLNYLFSPECEMTGWIEYPVNYDKTEFKKIKEVSKKIIKNSDVLLVVGIGGSYLGANAGIELLKNNKGKEVRFVGTNFSARDLLEHLEYCKNKDVTINLISKSGGTTEVLIVMKILEDYLKKKYKKNYQDRIIITTDATKGYLREYANINNIETFTVPSDIGGRYSVLTSVGLLPFAVAGLDINKIMQGAKVAYDEFKTNEFENNNVYKYSILRNFLYSDKKYATEVLGSFDPYMESFGKWWQQLFAESEGKDEKGLFVCPLSYSKDLHSVGQFVQQGKRNLIETFIYEENENKDILIEGLQEDSPIKYLEGKSFSEINKCAYLGTLSAHKNTGMPIFEMKIEKIDEYNLGYLYYFFEASCALSGLLLGVNPFNQPGVEDYKTNMKNLLKNN